MNPLDRFYQTSLGRFVVAWSELRAGEGAVLIAWQLLFSLFPLVVGLLSVAGLVLRDPERLDALSTAIYNQFPEQASELLTFMTETRDLGGIFGLVSVLGLLWSGSNLFGVMARVFNRFYGVQDRTFASQRLMSFAMMAVYSVLVSVSVASTSVTGLVVSLSEDVLPFEIPGFALVLGWAISLASAILMFLVLYRVVPNARIRVWHVWKGSILAGFLFVALSQVFPIYLSFLGGGFAAYKALGVFLLLMTWFYFLGIILCLGALANAVSSGHCPEPGTVRREEERKTATAARAPSGEATGGAVKTLLWAGVSAATTSVVLLLTRRLAVSLWRAATRQDPPTAQV